ncbi:glucosaminidase domain-containing protein [Candidatus Pelagibacter sp.]|nr:glucosaminidase domain-containing protein [Candidatus Pelagibacter sp.]
MQNKITLNQVKKFLLKKGLIVTEKNKRIFFRNDFKSIYFTALSSLFLILFFYSLPIFFEFKKNSIISSIEVTNNSKSNFEKVLDGEALEKSEKVDEGLDLKNLFEDVFKLDDLPSDTVRLSASTIEQLFKDTNYTLEDVRSTKLVKPIALSLLPEEIKKIESTKKRKNLFIQIILPLVIEENNKIKLDRRKLFNILNKNHNTDLEKKWLNSKFKQYGVLNKDLSTLKVRMDIVPVSLAIAQAAKETGWGTSRFALEGNALFGQWTWSGEGIKPAGADDDATHKVMKFKILKSSVRAYQRNLNTHSSYKQFRMARAELRDNKVKLDSLLLVNYLDKYAETGKEYTKILKKIIQQNSLTDFDDVKLLPSSIQLKSLI